MTYVIVEATQTRLNDEAARLTTKAVEFVFQFPPIQGAFDTGYGIVYIFGELHENEIEDIIVHETLHYVVQKTAGKKASLKLDRIHKATKMD